MSRSEQGPRAAPVEDLASLASNEWQSFIDPLADLAATFARRMSDPGDTLLRHELYRAVFSQISAAYIGLLHADPRHPDFWPWFNLAHNNLGPNPDDVFGLTPLDDDGVYRISGFRGNVRIVDFQLGTGSFIPRGSFDDPVFSTTLANYDLDSLKLAADGSFDVILSARRPLGHSGDWWELGSKASYLLVRQIAYDWLHEVDARLSIERLDRPAVKPRLTTDELRAKLSQIAPWVANNLKFTFDYLDGVRKQRGNNGIGFVNFAEFGGISVQKYANGTFELDADEALILECSVPECRYWSIHLIDDLFLSLDWMNRQTSLNGHTARIDRDGRFRVVISSHDPGVPNWLDTAGYRSGGMQGRWKHCSAWPELSMVKVAFDQVRAHLPHDTPVIAPEQRDEAIRLRRKGAQLRRRW